MIMIENARVYNVRDMYNQSKTDNKPLLSSYGGEGSFWTGYKANHAHFDRLFMRKFTSLIPLDQVYSDGIEYITDEFRADVYAWLLANDKRYTELFRVNDILDNAAYSLTNNVDYTETTNKSVDRDIEFTKGRQQNSLDSELLYGSQEVTQDNETAYGAQSGNNEKTVSAFNSNTYDPDERTQYTESAHTDTQDNTTTYGAHTDTREDTVTEGSRTDNTEEDIVENITTHKVGNMGVQTVDDMLLKHWDNWSMFDFYGLIFDDIAKNLLRGC